MTSNTRLSQHIGFFSFSRDNIKCQNLNDLGVNIHHWLKATTPPHLVTWIHWAFLLQSSPPFISSEEPPWLQPIMSLPPYRSFAFHGFSDPTQVQSGCRWSSEKVSRSLTPRHRAYIIHLTSSHHVGPASSPFLISRVSTAQGSVRGRAHSQNGHYSILFPVYCYKCSVLLVLFLVSYCA